MLLMLAICAGAGCAPKTADIDRRTYAAGQGLAKVQAHLGNVKWAEEGLRGHVKDGREPLLDALGYNATQAQTQLAEADTALQSAIAEKDRAIDSLQHEVINKTQQLVAEHEEKKRMLDEEHRLNKYVGWRVRQILRWAAALAGIGLVAAIVFSNFTPAGWLGKLVSAAIGFVISIPGRVRRLWCKKKDGPPAPSADAGNG